MTTETAIHCFQKAGLGNAGFRCVGLYSIPSPSMCEHNPAAYNTALSLMSRDLGCGSCAFCGTAIMHNFIIESADGKRFVVAPVEPAPSATAQRSIVVVFNFLDEIRRLVPRQ